MKLIAFSKRIKAVLLFLGLFSIVIFLWLSLIDFMEISDSHAKSTVKNQLSEFTVQTADSVKNEVQSMLSFIKSTATVFSYSDNMNSDTAMDYIEVFTSDSVFDRMWLTAPNGTSYSTRDNVIDISERDYFKKMMSGESGITAEMPSLYNDELIFVAYSPIYKDAQITGGLYGVYEIKRLLKTIQTETFGGQGLTNLIKKDGTVLISSDSQGTLNEELNIWPFLESCEYQNETASGYNEIYTKVQSNKSGFTKYKFETETRIAYYTPIEINDWYLFSSIPESIVTNHTDLIDKTAVLLTAKILFVLGVLIIVILVYGYNSRKIILKANRDFEFNNQRLKIAMSHNTNLIFEYDPVTNVIEIITPLPPNWEIPAVIPNGYLEMIDSGYIDPEFIDGFKNCFDRIKNGESVAYCLNKLWYNKEHFAWNKVAVTNIFDEKGKAIRAIGTVEDVTEAKETELRYAKEEQYRNVMLSATLDVYEIDVTTNTLESLTKNKQPGDPDLIGADYNEARKRFASSCVHADDREVFLHMSDPSTLIVAYQNQDAQLDCEYRRTDMGDESVWVSSTTNVLKDPTTGDMKAFIYVKNINKEKKKELALKCQAEQDPLVGIYNRVTAQGLITEFLENTTASAIHGFFTIDLDRFKSINDRFGHMTGDYVLKQVGEMLSGIFKATDIVARLGGDEFIVFQKNVRSRQEVEAKATEVCETFRKINVAPDFYVSGSVGVAIASEDGNSFAELYEKSDIALYYAKSNGKDCFAAYSSKMEIIDGEE